MREAWTDERLDYLNHRVDDLNTRVDDLNTRVDRLSDRVDRGFDRVDVELRAVNGRIDGLHEGLGALQRTMVHAVIALTVGMLAGFGGIAGLIATQL